MSKYYLTPESCHSNTIPLFKCDKFPDKWKLIKKLLQLNVV